MLFNTHTEKEEKYEKKTDDKTNYSKRLLLFN